MPWMEIWYPNDDDNTPPRVSDVHPSKEELTFVVPTGIFTNDACMDARWSFPRSLLEDLVNRTKEAIAHGCVLYGEFCPDHHDSLTSPDRISHLILDLYIAENSQLMGKIMICWANFGRIAQAAIYNGCAVRLAPRHLRNIDDKKLVTWDLMVD